MPEKIEKILRAIHILLAKGETYKDNPDRVVISKHELFGILEQLNLAIAEMMDNYEASKTAKARAKREIEESGMEIINGANAQAEDIYAAALLYTDGSLNEIYDEVNNARAGMRREFDRFDDRMDNRLEELRQNQKELMDMLRALQQGNKYFGLIDDYNKRLAIAEQQEAERQALASKDLEAEAMEQRIEAIKKAKEARDMEHIDDIISGKAFAPKPPVIPETFKRRKGTAPHAMGEAAHREEGPGLASLLTPDTEDLEDIRWPDEPEEIVPVEVQFNSNWGSKENNVLETSRFKTKKQRDREKKYGKKPAKKKSKYDFDDEEIQLTVDPDEDPEAPMVFTMESLDAEYERWQAENEKNGKDRK